MKRTLKVAPVKSHFGLRHLGVSDFLSGIIAAIVVDQLRSPRQDAGFIPFQIFCAILHDWQRHGEPFGRQLRFLDFSDSRWRMCYSGKIRSFLAENGHLLLNPAGDWIVLRPSEAVETLKSLDREFDRRVVVALETKAMDFGQRWIRYAYGEDKHGKTQKRSRR